MSPSRRRRPRARARPARLAALAWLLVSAAGPVLAQAPLRNWADLSLEELMNETVTSVSKREQRLADSPAAVSVLTNDDLRRSGATTLADALRLVPGMNVASVNSRQWAVSARGFNGLYANKLLVLVDGRAVYSPMFAGVYWDAEHALFEDIDRVEIIRGPGATVWGANAVNGVVNLVTRGARETQGSFVQASAGDVEEHSAAVRHGGRLGDKTYYRVSAGERSRDEFLLPDGRGASDGWGARHAEFRLDHHPDDSRQITWLAGATRAETDNGLRDGQNLHTLGRVTRRFSDRSGFELQAYYDRTTRDEQPLAHIQTDTLDFSAQHTFAIGERHDFIWGAGFRAYDNKITQTTPLLLVRDEDVATSILSAFAQDEFRLVPDKLVLTAGVKIEHNSFTGLELQPSLRATAKPTERQTFWGAVSRAVRTPSGIEGRDIFAVALGAPFVGPGGGLYAPRVVGDRDSSAEVLWAYEAGYRFQPSPHLSLDLALFYNVYEDILSSGGIERFVPGVPVGTAEIPFANIFGGETGGGEISATFSPAESWRLTAGYALLLANIDGPAGSAPELIGEGSPRNQAILRSSHELVRGLGLDAQLRYVDSIRSVPAYLTADLRISYRHGESLEVSLVGQNLLQDQHPEQGPTFFVPTSEVPRGFYGKVTWRF